jgi:hypothetical protein
VSEIERIVAQIRKRWSKVRILLRADSGFPREKLMSWSEAHRVDYLFSLAKNERLIAEIDNELIRAEAKSRRIGKVARCFKDFMWTTRDSWSRRRRVVAKAEYPRGGANPRFVVTSLTRQTCKPDCAPGPSIHDVLANSPLRPARHFARGSRVSARD